MRTLAFLRLTEKSSRSRIAILVKLSAVLVPLVAIYWQDLDLVFREALANDFMNFILIIPLLVGYTVYRKRKMLKAISSLNTGEQEKRTWMSDLVAGTLLLSVSFFILFLGSYTSYALEYHFLSLPLFVAGSVALAFNLQTLRTLLFPVALLFLIQPYLIQLTNPFWSDLSSISSTASYNLLRTIGIPANFTTVLEVPTIEITSTSGQILSFTVGVASSGLNSFLGFSVFAIFVTYILRGPLWKKVTLMLAGYPLLILLNTLRITIILSLAYQWGTAIAEIFHLTGGLVLVFIGTFLLLFVGERIWKVRIYSGRMPVSSCTHCGDSLGKGHAFCTGCGKLLKSLNHVIGKQGALKIASVILAALLFLTVRSPPIAMAKPPTEIDLTTISPEESTQLLPTISGWDLIFLYRDNRVETILKQDAALAFAYITRDTMGRNYTYIVTAVQISTGRHTWEASLITWPIKFGRPTATVLDLRDVQILEDPVITARFFAYQRPGSNLTEVVLYWFQRVPFKIGSLWDMRNVQISLWSYSDDLAKSGLISTPSDLTGVEKMYLPFARSIVNYWQPIKTSSQITTIVSMHTNEIAATLSLIFAGLAIPYAYERRKEKKRSVEVYDKLSKPYRMIIDVIHQTEKTTRSTLDSVAARYQSVTGEDVVNEELLKKLLELERVGVVRSQIISHFDEPIQIWKTRIDYKNVRKRQVDADYNPAQRI